MKNKKMQTNEKIKKKNTHTANINLAILPTIKKNNKSMPGRGRWRRPWGAAEGGAIDL